MNQAIIQKNLFMMIILIIIIFNLKLIVNQMKFYLINIIKNLMKL